MDTHVRNDNKHTLEYAAESTFSIVETASVTDTAVPERTYDSGEPWLITPRDNSDTYLRTNSSENTITTLKRRSSGELGLRDSLLEVLAGE